jgi:hypothetical protein
MRAGCCWFSFDQREYLNAWESMSSAGTVDHDQEKFCFDCRVSEMLAQIATSKSIAIARIALENPWKISAWKMSIPNPCDPSHGIPPGMVAVTHFENKLSWLVSPEKPNTAMPMKLNKISAVNAFMPELWHNFTFVS